jgi:hypothetical protein
MLSEEQVSSCIDGLIRLGVLHRVPGRAGEEELIRFKMGTDGLIGRIFHGEYGEPPEGVDVVPWFSCILLKALLEEEKVSVSREQFTGMAAVIMGFVSEGAVPQAQPSGQDEAVISQRRPNRTK